MPLSGTKPKKDRDKDKDKDKVQYSLFYEADPCSFYRPHPTRTARSSLSE